MRNGNGLTGDYRHFDPFHRPSWRWDSAEALCREGRRPKRWEDPAIGAALSYLRGFSQNHGPSARRSCAGRYREIAAAHELFRSAMPTRHEVEARLLAGQSTIDIAAKVSLDVAVLDSYSTFFFDVGDAVARGAVDWLLLRAVATSDWRQRQPDEGDAWRYWSLAGGPVILELLIEDYRRGSPLPEREHRACRLRDAGSGVVDPTPGWSGMPTIQLSQLKRPPLREPGTEGVGGRSSEDALSAQKARLLLLDFAESLRPDVRLARQILTTAAQLFRHPPRGRGKLASVSDDEARLNVHGEFLRWFTGPLPRRGVRLANFATRCLAARR